MGRRRVRNLLAVLIRAREEVDLAPIRAMVPRDHIGRDRLVRVTHVRRPIGVVDRRRDEVGSAFGFGRERRERRTLCRRRAPRR